MRRPKKIRRDIATNVNYRQDVDGLRGLAISFVLAQHLLGSHISFGFLGVDIFFVLSGYVIYNSYFKFSEFKLNIFLWNRFSRLAPGILAVLMLTLLMPSLRSMSSLGDFIRVLLLVKNYGDWSWPLGPFWSLSAEEQFYLLAGIFVVFFRTRSMNITFLRLCVLLILLLQFFGLVLSLSSHNFNTPTFFNIVFFRPTQIVLGVLLGVAEDTKLFEKYRILILLLHPVLLSAYLAGAIYLGSPTLACLFAIGLLRCKESNSPLGHFFYKFLTSRRLVEIGVLSYSIYIWHVSVILLLPSLGSKPLHFLAELISIYLLSSLSFKYLEMPAKRKLNRLFARTKLR